MNHSYLVTPRNTSSIIIPGESSSHPPSSRATLTSTIHFNIPAAATTSQLPSIHPSSHIKLGRKRKPESLATPSGDILPLPHPVKAQATRQRHHPCSSASSAIPKIHPKTFGESSRTFIHQIQSEVKTGIIGSNSQQHPPTFLVNS